MFKKTILLGCLVVFSLCLCRQIITAAEKTESDLVAGYQDSEKVFAAMEEMASKNPALVRLLTLGTSAGGRKIPILEIRATGTRLSPIENRPAVFVAANLEGVYLPGTEAALELASKLVREYGKKENITRILERKVVYIAPLLNPDGAQSFFTSAKIEKISNDAPNDDDVDGVMDEDGPEDLNKDGYITQMRVKAPDGIWITDSGDSRLMKIADPSKGEKGIYKLYPSEGIDNDGDGEINEDPKGGIEIHRNFPHDFEYNSISAGRWPVSAVESSVLLDFLISKRQISLILCFSRENTILNLNQTGPAARSGDKKIRVPADFAAMLGLDSGTEYTMTELTEILGPMGFDESLISMILKTGPAMSMDNQDQALYESVQRDYKKGLKEAGIEGLEKNPLGVGKGSFAAYAYFQYGVPVFSANLWTVPESLDPGTKIPAETSGSVPHPDAGVLKWSDTALGGRGFVNWKPYKHPTLGDVEIGGLVPFTRIIPPRRSLDKSISFHTDFFIELMNRMARLEILEAKTEYLGGNLYKVILRVSNAGIFPTSTAQGRRAKTAWPIHVRLTLSKGQTLFSGQPDVSLPFLNGQGDSRTLEWTISGERRSALKVVLGVPGIENVETEIKLEEEKKS